MKIQALQNWVLRDVTQVELSWAVLVSPLFPPAFSSNNQIYLLSYGKQQQLHKVLKNIFLLYRGIIWVIKSIFPNVTQRPKD